MNAEGEKRVKLLRELAAKKGLEVIERPNGHFQIKGAYLVNYYPGSKRQALYVAGTTGCLPDPSPQRAVFIAAGERGFHVEKPGKRPRKSTVNKRRRLWDAGVRACYWCKRAFEKFEDATLEHVIPLSKGGLDNANNWALAHAACNTNHGDSLPHKTRAAVQPPEERT